jgi:hypothetical protein
MTLADASDGFTSMFNGKDLTGWEGSPSYWKVENGILTGTTDGTLKYNRFIVWRGGKVKNFEWRARVRVSPGGNSGLQYRSVERPDLGESVVVGYQCDVVSNRADYNGMLYEERGRRILAHTGEKVIIDTEGQPWVVDKLPVKEFKAGEWHDFRVLVEANRHRHWIDGHLTVDVIDLDEKGRKLEGILGMQVHVGPKMTIEYRDLYLKKLGDDLPLIGAAKAPIPPSAVKVVPQGKATKKKPKESALWNLDNLESIGGHPVTVVGKPRVLDAGGGKAIEFDGRGDGLFVAASPLAGLEKFTVEVIFRPAAGGPKEQRFLHFQSKGSEDRVLFETRLTPDGQWFLDTYLQSGNVKQTLYAEKFLHPLGSWHHAAIVVDGKTMRHYVGGREELAADIQPAPLADGQTSIGVRFNKVFWYQGAIRQIRVTPAALKPDAFLKLSP